MAFDSAILLDNFPPLTPTLFPSSSTTSSCFLFPSSTAIRDFALISNNLGLSSSDHYHHLIHQQQQPLAALPQLMAPRFVDHHQQQQSSLMMEMVDNNNDHNIFSSSSLVGGDHHPSSACLTSASSMTVPVSPIAADDDDACGGGIAKQQLQQQPTSPPSFLSSVPSTLLVEPPSVDYVTVPSMLATVDVAMPAEPCPLVQLPFKVPLLSVELCHRRPSLDDGLIPPPVLPPSLIANGTATTAGSVVVGPSPTTQQQPLVVSVEDAIGGGASICATSGVPLPPTTTMAINDNDARYHFGRIGAALDDATTTISIDNDGNNVVGIVCPEAAMPLAENAGLSAFSIAVSRPLKRVRFADDCGQCLETVRVMTEPSDYPPKISPAVLRRIRRAAAAASAAISVGTDANGQPISASTIALEEDSDELEFEAEESQRRDQPNQHRRSWKMAFRQPASEYVRFRDSLDRQRVALENVMLKNELSRMVGTIKVANIAFEKHVFVRHTANGWKTFNDVEAKWQCSPSKAYDTFRFDVLLPRNETPCSRVEFCVRFLAGSSPDVEEHWDSNDGHNFVLLAHDQHPTTMTTATTTIATTTTQMPLTRPMGPSASMPLLLAHAASPPFSTPSFLASSQASSAALPVAQMTANVGGGGGVGGCAAITKSLSSPLLDINHNNNNNDTNGINDVGIGTKTATAGGRYRLPSSSPRPIERRPVSPCDRDDPYRMDWNSPNGWSSTTFGAWKQLSTDGPYW